MNHLTHDQLSAALDHELSGGAAERVEAHLRECATCREALAALASQDSELQGALTHDPGDAYFEDFAARVEDRVRAAGFAGAQARRATGRWNSPRTLAWAGALATVIVGAALVLIAGREVRPPALRDREITLRADQVAPPPATMTPTPSVSTKEDEASRLGAAAPLATPAPAGDISHATRATDERLAEPQREEQREFITGNERVLARERGSASALDQMKDVKQQAAQKKVDAPAAPTVVRGGRASEVKLNAAGEPVPASPSPIRNLTQPVPSASSTPAENDLVRRKRLAAPMQKSLDAAKPEAVARTQEEAPPPAATTAPALQMNLSLREATTTDGSLCGEVHDTRGRPVAGAQVVLTDVARSATTDANGAFCIAAPAGEHALAVMAVGYTESRQSVEVGIQQSSVRVTLAAVPVLEGRGSTWGTIKGVYDGGSKTSFVSPSAGARDAYAGTSDSVRMDVSAARQLEAAAQARRSASMYDAAATRWERALRRVSGGALDVETRHHLAESRYHAWEASPNARRATAAVEALTSYIARAPAGRERDEAARWLDRVRR